LAPVVFQVVDVHQVGPVAEGGHEADWKPVAGGLAQAGLIFYVVGQVRERVALRFAAVVGDGFISASEADRLEGKESDLPWIIESELNNASNLLVVHASNDGHDRNDFDSGR